MRTKETEPDGDQLRLQDGELDVGALLRSLWDDRITIGSITATCLILGVCYALLGTKWYEATVVLIPIEETTSPLLSGQLSGLANLAGLGFSEGGTSIEGLTIVQSREFARAFIDEGDLTRVFFAKKWDANSGTWKGSNELRWPDIRDAIDYFHSDILNVDQNRQNSVVTISIQWTDPVEAARWANSIAFRLNHKMREQALRDAETNVAFLQRQLSETSIVTLQQSISRLLESEMQKLMLARSSEDYAFRIVDRAVPPKYPSQPIKSIVIALATMIGLIAGVTTTMFVRILRK